MYKSVLKVVSFPLNIPSNSICLSLHVLQHVFSDTQQSLSGIVSHQLALSLHILSGSSVVVLVEVDLVVLVVRVVVVVGWSWKIIFIYFTIQKAMQIQVHREIIVIECQSE